MNVRLCDMPPASVSLLFTWSVESVLLGLTGLALFGWTWPILSQLVLASVTATAHLLLAARFDSARRAKHAFRVLARTRHQTYYLELPN